MKEDIVYLNDWLVCIANDKNKSEKNEEGGHYNDSLYKNDNNEETIKCIWRNAEIFQ